MVCRTALRPIGHKLGHYEFDIISIGQYVFHDQHRLLPVCQPRQSLRSCFSLLSAGLHRLSLHVREQQVSVYGTPHQTPMPAPPRSALGTHRHRHHGVATLARQRPKGHRHYDWPIGPRVRSVKDITSSASRESFDGQSEVFRVKEEAPAGIATIHEGGHWRLHLQPAQRDSTILLGKIPLPTRFQ